MQLTKEQVNHLIQTNNEAVHRALLTLSAQGVLKNRFHQSLGQWVRRGRRLTVKQLQAVRKGDQFEQYLPELQKAADAKNEVEFVVQAMNVCKELFDITPNEEQFAQFKSDFVVLREEWHREPTMEEVWRMVFDEHEENDPEVAAMEAEFEGEANQWRGEEIDGDYGNWAEEQMVIDEMNQMKIAEQSKDSDDFNQRWIEHKNEFAHQERNAEQAAFEEKMHRIGG